jgi:hypothetical protein
MDRPSLRKVKKTDFLKIKQFSISIISRNRQNRHVGFVANDRYGTHDELGSFSAIVDWKSLEKKAKNHGANPSFSTYA